MGFWSDLKDGASYWSNKLSSGINEFGNIIKTIMAAKSKNITEFINTRR